MRRKLWRMIGVVILFLAATGSRAWAQLPEGWDLQLEPMWMSVKGFNEHKGDIVREQLTFALGPSDQLLVTDTLTREPINLNLDSGPTFRGELTYRRQPWGAGISGWFFNTGDAVSGTVTSPPPIFTPTSDTFFANSVSMWQETLLPVINELEPSGFSPVRFFARGALDTFTLDLFALRTLAETPSSRLDLTFGAKIGRLETTQAQGFSEQAFIFDFFDPGLHFNNFISLSTTAQADFLGAGPMVGLRGEAKWRRFGIQALLTESLLIGDADQRGRFTDIDDISATPSPTGPFTPVLFIRSDIPFSKSETVFIPVTEFQLKLKVDITKNVAIGASGFVSIWLDAPVTPTFTITHVGAGPGLNWKLEEQTLRFLGVSLALQIRF